MCCFGVRSLALAALVAVWPVPASGADAPATVELRLGTHVIGAAGFPSVGVYGTLPVGRGWSAGMGYEFFRVFEGYLATSCDTAGGPLIVGGVRAGLWRHGRRELGTFARAGILLGVASPLFSIKPLPQQDTDAVLEIGADLQAGWAWEHVRLVLYTMPIYSIGSLSSSGPGFQSDEDVTGFSLTTGLGVFAAF